MDTIINELIPLLLFIGKDNKLNISYNASSLTETKQEINNKRKSQAKI